MLPDGRYGSHGNNFGSNNGGNAPNNRRMYETGSTSTISTIGASSHEDLIPINTRATYLKRTTRRERRLLVLLVVLGLTAAALLIALIILACLYLKRSYAVRICDSPECIRSAANLKRSMDPTADPCDDFYRYTCGGWPRDHPIPGAAYAHSWFDERADRVQMEIRAHGEVLLLVSDFLKQNDSDEDPEPVRKARLMYRVCMDTQTLESRGLSPAKRAMESVGLELEAPAPLGGGAVPAQSSWSAVIGRTRRLLAYETLFGVGVYWDLHNRSVNTIMLGRPASKSPLPSHQELEERIRKLWRMRARQQVRPAEPRQCGGRLCAVVSQSRRRAASREELAYVDYVRAAATHAHVWTRGRSSAAALDRDLQDEAAWSILDFEQSLRKAYYEESTGQDYSLMTVAELQNLTDAAAEKGTTDVRVNWREFLEEVFSGVENVTLRLDGRDADLVAVLDVDYLTSVATILANHNADTVWTSLWWQVFRVLSPHTDRAMRQLKHNYLEASLGIQFRQARKAAAGQAAQPPLGKAARLRGRRPSAPKAVATEEGPQAPERPPGALPDEAAREASTGRAVGVVAATAAVAALGAAAKPLLCASAVNQLLGMVVSYMYVAEPRFLNSTRRKVEEMIEDIQKAFETLVTLSDWLDQTTKEATITKVRAMSRLVAFPDWLANRTTFEEYYQELEIQVGEHLENMLGILRLQVYSMLSTLRTTNNNVSADWASDPTTVNAYHTFQSNAITIPAAILDFPFYDLGVEALNYGAIGSILAHEVTHGFDDTGRQYDPRGELVPWWTNRTVEAYSNRTQCYINQYSAYEVPEVNKKVDGEQTLDENIADNGGLLEAFVAYQLYLIRNRNEDGVLPGFQNFTHNQMFFIGYGNMWCTASTPRGLKWALEDEHAPNHVRVQGTLSNLPNFAEAFSCPNGSRMNPNNRCKLW
ncbi:neprilysin-1-like [Schistocerca americana]|uniref:neprilysin-1-like n=1 Tax=Schistocerca americana TaxID=7009 RepID=UPI001F4FD826|nr:neprilysin-1-like [Schistocerca americana]